MGVRISQVELIALNDKLREVCKSTIVDGDKIATYNDGWSDERVLKALQPSIPTLNAGHVKNFRLKLYGEVDNRRGGGNTRLKSAERDLANITARLAVIEAFLKQEFPEEWRKACALADLNRNWVDDPPT